jgi:bifunctional non-homologous end joining protein LigD
VVVPLAAEWPTSDVKIFSKNVVEHLVRTIPQRFVAKSGARNRVGKIFVDYLRNGQGQTTAAAFTLRARPGLGVSMPVSWDDILSLERGDQWTIWTAAEHVRTWRKDPWAAYHGHTQSLAIAAEALDRAWS